MKAFFGSLACMLFLYTSAFADLISKYETHDDVHPYTQTLGLEMGSFHPASLSISNSNNRFDYSGKSLNSVWVEPKWSIKLFHFAGAFYLEEGMPLSFFNGKLPDSETAHGETTSLFVLGIDTRLKYAMEWFPLKAFIPFVEGGYQYSLYSQSGPSDFESVQGSVGNWVAGAGLDFWINASSSERTIPLFLSAKVNRIFSSSNSVNFDSVSYLGSMSIGI